MMVEQQERVEQAGQGRGVLEAGTEIEFRYKVESVDRRCAFGVRYRALDQVCGTTVSLLRLRREFADADVRARLLEARADAASTGPAIADLRDYGVDIDGRTYLVTERVADSVCLEQHLESMGGSSRFEQALGIVQAVAAALAPAHVDGLVHGGLEPSSVLLQLGAHASGGASVELQCFGLLPALPSAGAVGQGRAFPLVSSASYVAPELIRGLELTPRTDVYSLGALAWTLLSGAAPFVGPSLRVLDAHLHKDLPELELPVSADPALGALLERMLAKDPADRPADAAEVLVELRRLRPRNPAAVVEAVALASTQPIAVAVTPDPRHGADYGDAGVPQRIGLGSMESMESVAPVNYDDEDDASFGVFSLPRNIRRRGHSRLGRWAAVGALAASLLLTWGVVSLGGGSSATQLVAAADSQAASHVAERPEQADRAPQLIPAEDHAESRAARARGADQADLEAEGTELPDVSAPHRKKLGGGQFNARKQELYRRAARCSDGSLHRTVKLGIRVDPSGQVSRVSLAGGMAKTKLGRCIKNQGKKLSFPATQTGGRHVYTLRLR